jgi:poly-gamma-glutamate synthesis protein (capsule biosynthesis protein)
MPEQRLSQNSRRAFLRWATGIRLMGWWSQSSAGSSWKVEASQRGQNQGTSIPKDTITLFLGGDVMTGRAIDQVLPYPGDPRLYEPYVRDARQYVQLAEAANGTIEAPVDFSYIWGDALAELERVRPDVRLINLETAVTVSDDPWPAKGIHYRMCPRNLPAINAAAIQCCSLANNHVLDWGYRGLTETLRSLHQAGIATVGAGSDLQEACAPAIQDVPGKGRVIILGLGHRSSGIPRDWAAACTRPGVCLLDDLSARTVSAIARQVRGMKRKGDFLVVSIHWGGNWGYQVPDEQRRFAHGLIEEAGVDLVHGHSSHHVKGIEIHRGRLILYGCGDFLNDYEGISGYEAYRGDLSLMYFPTLEVTSGQLSGLRMTPIQVRRLRVNRAGKEDVRWLQERLNREGERFGTRVEIAADNTLTLLWD